MTELKYAQDLIKVSNSNIKGGFNAFIMGDEEPRLHDYGCRSDWNAQLQGYKFAKKMSKEDAIAFTYKFKCKCSGTPFKYGGFFVCNSCGGKGVDKKWWKIQVEKDGNSYCCHGLDFINLQESSNYAFGDTYQDSINNYEKVMINDRI